MRYSHARRAHPCMQHAMCVLRYIHDMHAPYAIRMRHVRKQPSQGDVRRGLLREHRNNKLLMLKHTLDRLPILNATPQ